MAKIRQSNLDNSIVTGLGELTSVASGDQTIVYDASTGTLKKISQTNFLNFPTISSVSPTSVLSGDGTGNYTFTITGSGFTSGSADLINNSGTSVAFDTVTIDSDTQITAVIAKSSLPASGEPYDVRVSSTNGLRGTLDNQINIDQSPTFVTASGSLGSSRFDMSGISVNATDPESAGNVTFELQSGSLPPGISITNTAAEGGTATFTGTISSLASSDTIYNFTLRAVDAASNTSSRAFSFTAQGPQVESFTSSGTFSVPTGATSVDTLVVGGGGGGGSDNGGGAGAGGLIFMPGYPVTPGGTITVTVGCGGPGGIPGSANGTAGQDSVLGSPGDPGLGQGGVLTAKGGGAGVGQATGNGVPGGSGGGANGHGGTGSTATQPTQPGNSGAYGFGNTGGAAGNPRRGGGGGGAGSASTAAGNYAGSGGDGRSYTIADGTTPVTYAGGGGGGSCAPNTQGQGGPGGGGRGGSPDTSPQFGVSGTANRGGGGGGGGNGGCKAGGAGGKGIVIVRY